MSGVPSDYRMLVKKKRPRCIVGRILLLARSDQSVHRNTTAGGTGLLWKGQI